MTIQDVFRGFTIWVAVAAFREKVLDSIEEGKLADFTFLDRNILELPARDILEVRVLYTIVGGRIVYEANGDKIE